jgi:hypothetical protein
MVAPRCNTNIISVEIATLGCRPRTPYPGQGSHAAQNLSGEMEPTEVNANRFARMPGGRIDYLSDAMMR